MSEHVNFKEFEEVLRDGDITPEQRRIAEQIIELDPESPIPRLRLIPGIVVEDMPEDFDVDNEVYKLLRWKIDEEREMKIQAGRISSEPEVVTEGDSWFYHPCIRTIGQWLERDNGFNSVNIAYHGDTLDEIMAARQWEGKIDRDKTKYLLLSAGGNDLQDKIMDYIYDYDQERPIDQYITDLGLQKIKDIGQGYGDVLSSISNKFPTTKTLCYGYDYPRPNNSGQYIGKYLKNKGIPEDMMIPIMSNVIDALHTVPSHSISVFPGAIYVDCRGVTTPADSWYDDMHPDSKSFFKLTSEFKTHMVF